jgi:hypothetical protein
MRAMRGDTMNNCWLAAIGLAAAVSAGPPAALVAEDDQPVPIPREAALHPVFAPDAEQVAAAAELGRQYRRRKKTVEELAALWSQRVPDADGRAVMLTPAARVAMAAYEAEKLHKDAEERDRMIGDALRESEAHLIFQVTLRSKGSVSWIWPRDAEPGDRKALETVAFTLGDDRGDHCQPLDPEAARKVVGKSVSTGLPFPVTTYQRLGRHWWVSIPIFGPGRRQDFEASYTVVFPIADEQGRPLLTDDLKTLSLEVIGARAQKSVAFRLDDLAEVVEKHLR